MLFFPLGSIAVEISFGHGSLSLILFAKWFVFWMVGVRLFMAGLRQIIQPRFTAEKILGIKGDDVLLVVRELGFANISVGTIGIISLYAPSWVTPCALVGGLFYALAGINHIKQSHRSHAENVAMVSDLWAALILIGYLVATMLH